MQEGWHDGDDRRRARTFINTNTKGMHDGHSLCVSRGVISMGWFDFFKKKKQEEKLETPAEYIDADAYAKIARILTDNAETLRRLDVCFADPAAFARAHEERYDERGMDAHNRISAIAWIGLVDALMEIELACEFDWKEELAEFIAVVRPWAEAAGLAWDTELLEENADIPVWCAALNAAWKEDGFCILRIDIDSDSYVLLLIETERAEQVQRLAAEVGQKMMIY